MESTSRKLKLVVGTFTLTIVAKMETDKSKAQASGMHSGGVGQACMDRQAFSGSTFSKESGVTWCARKAAAAEGNCQSLMMQW